MLEVTEPSPEDWIEILEDLFQTLATGAPRLLTDLLFLRRQTLLAHDPFPCLEAIAQKLKALSLLQAVAHLGLVRVKHQPVGLGPCLDLGQRAFGFGVTATKHDSIVRGG